MSSFAYIDLHSHLNFPEFDTDREEILASMKEKKIGTITIGTSFETSKSVVELAEKNENVFAGIGIHPVDQPNSVFNEKEFEMLVQSPKVVAIGECGLDYGKAGIIDEEEKKKQMKLFEQQIDFAIKWNKPIMIHARNSNEDILDILENKKKEYGNKLTGNAHFYSGSTEQEKRYFDLGFTVSFTGVITFTTDYDEQVKYAPISKIMAETDSPFVSPAPFRGKRNSPLNVEYVIKKIAQIRGENEESIRLALLENSLGFIKINQLSNNSKL